MCVAEAGGTLAQGRSASSASTSAASQPPVESQNSVKKEIGLSLYNFLSTFSGTHYVTPRAVSAQVGFHF
jgi:hypothetical protein